MIPNSDRPAAPPTASATRAVALGLAVGAALCVSLLAGCATTPPLAADGWQQQTLPGKPNTHYRWTQKEGRTALQADSQQSASLWRKRLDPAEPAPQQVRFSWWVQDLIPQASVAQAHLEDSPARVVFGFDGDRQRLSARNRNLFDLAETLTGEAPPFATLMYVWDPALPVGTVVVNPRTDRIRKIVVDSGPQHLRSWRDHQRNLAEDFRRAFNEEPGALVSVAVMSDSDNTKSQARSWFGPVQWGVAKP
ncbi:MAG: DUF3047 domain-containing protein [Betaproteobacteria bacterium]|nr:DUF3047 domain-containing protein [Betaproteobacteria bacterium]